MLVCLVIMPVKTCHQGLVDGFNNVTSPTVFHHIGTEYYFSIKRGEMFNNETLLDCFCSIMKQHVLRAVCHMWGIYDAGIIV